MGVQGIDTQTQLSRTLLLSYRIRLPCVGMQGLHTRQAESGPTRLLPNHLGLPQTNNLGQCTHTGRYRTSSHREDCCLPHGTHVHDKRQMPDTNCSTSCYSRLKSRKSFMRTVTPLDSSASSSRLHAALERQPDRRASLRQHGTGSGRVFDGWIWRGLALLAIA